MAEALQATKIKNWPFASRWVSIHQIFTHAVTYHQSFLHG